MIHVTLLLSFFLFAKSSVLPNARTVTLNKNEDAQLTVPQLITKYNYPVEEHHVVTPDGYILSIQRIPYGRNSNTTSNKVVFLMHGILCSSADWIITGVDHSFAFILADQGYDVWMGNARGNTYSRNHTTLNPDKDAEFWQFSWHEIGVIDLPTMIDYVLEVTNQKQLYHIGHSQGTTTFYVMTSMLPEYNNKIKAHFSLSPIAYMSHIISPFVRLAAYFNGPLNLILTLLGANEFLPKTEFVALAGSLLCGDDDITQILCTDLLYVIFGFSPQESNATILPAILGHTPAGSSTKQLVHYAQEVVSGAFRQYDFGLSNLFIYGRITPPDYNLAAIKAPVYLLYSRSDWLAAETDVNKLYNGLGNTCKGKFLVSNDNFNHMDYLYGIRAPELVYNRVISLMTKIDDS